MHRFSATFDRKNTRSIISLTLITALLFSCNSNTDDQTDTQTDTQTQTQIAPTSNLIDSELIISAVTQAFADFDILTNDIYSTIAAGNTTKTNETNNESTVKVVQHQCPVSGTWTENYAEHYQITYTSNNCVTQEGQVEIELNNANGGISFEFSVTTSQGTSTVINNYNFDETQRTLIDNNNNTYIFNQSENGDIYYAVNTASVQIDNTTLAFTQNNLCEYQNTIKTTVSNNHVLDQDQSVFTIEEPINRCITDFDSTANSDFEFTDTWASAENSMVYQLNVTTDNNYLNLSIVSQDLETLIESIIIEDTDSNIVYSNKYSTPKIYKKISTYLSTGVYLLKIKHFWSPSDISEFYFQAQIDNTQITYHSQLDAPIVLSQYHINQPQQFELVIFDQETFYFQDNNVDTQSFNLIELIDEQGLPIDSLTLYQTKNSLKKQLEPGIYFVKAFFDFDNEYDLILKADNNNSARLNLSSTAPKTITNNTPYSVMLNIQYTQQDFTLDINLQNYEQMENLYQSVDTHFSNIEQIMEGLSNVETTQTINNEENNITTYQCQTSGNIIKEVNVNSNNSSITSIDCLQTNGVLEINQIIDNDDYKMNRFDFSYITQANIRMSVDYQASQSQYNVYDEFFISLEDLGEFLVRGDSYQDDIYYFGANNSYLVHDYHYEQFKANSYCHSQTISEHELNDEYFDIVVEDSNNCIVDFDFEQQQNWTQLNSKLEYTLTINADNTQLDAFFTTLQYYSGLKVLMYNSTGEELFNNNNSEYLFKTNLTLDSGDYTIFIENTFFDNSELANGLYLQLKASDSTFEYITEHLQPSHSIKIIEATYTHAYEALSYQFIVTHDAFFTLTLDTPTYVALEIYDNSKNRILLDNTFLPSGYPIINYFKAGTYTVTLTNSGTAPQTLLVELKSSIENSATVTTIE
ncbi:MAG: hypothetical protein HRU38_15315 [Saccharospirillaceae bacterium]|nr:hypothetical protein [Pseudomonadales bacterium]NRB80012.1 hypothetical protein [Saccharospirillaceae bacterium]